MTATVETHERCAWCDQPTIRPGAPRVHVATGAMPCADGRHSAELAPR
jgi:hypothetical protein